MAPHLLVLILSTSPAPPSSPAQAPPPAAAAAEASERECDCVAAVRLLWQMPLVAWAHAAAGRCPTPNRTPPQPRRAVVLRAGPAWFDVWVDDDPQPRARNVMRKAVLSLSYGRHRLRFRNPLAHDLEIQVDVGADSPIGPIDVRLRRRD